MEPSNAKLRTYTVRTATNPPENIEVKADDVDLQEVGDTEKPIVYHYNFIIDDITVASFPYNHVLYITSRP